MLIGYLFIIMAAVFWGLIGIFSSVAFSQGVGPMEVAFWRAVLTWFCFGGQAVMSKQTKIDNKDFPLFLVFALFGISLFYISYQLAVKQGGPPLPRSFSIRRRPGWWPARFSSTGKGRPGSNSWRWSW